MHPTIRNLLALTNQPEPEDPGRPARVAVRIHWALERTAAWRRAQRAMDDRCTRVACRIDDDAFDQLFEAEQANREGFAAQQLLIPKIARMARLARKEPMKSRIFDRFGHQTPSEQ